jgi:hypothetical protein
MDDMAARQRNLELNDLRDWWGDFYRITWDTGQFTAERRDNRAKVRKPTGPELDEALREDMAANPVDAHGGILP